MEAFVLASPIGPLKIILEDHHLCAIELHDHGSTGEASPQTSYGRKVAKELSEYFSGRRQSFDLDIEMGGSEFDQLVWKALVQIPYGETRSYSEIARSIGRPKAFRAVGGACGRNPLLIVVPCHRVLAKGAKLGGFTGGLDVKKHLLALEGSF